MKDLKREFSLPIKGLQDGIHEYKFDLNSDFFEIFDKSLIKSGQFRVDLLFDKKPSLMVLDFTVVGQFMVPCDLCLKQIAIDINSTSQNIVKYTDMEIDRKDDDVYYILHEDSELNVADMIHELIHLQLPLSNTKDCESVDYKDCDQTMLSYLDNGNDPDQTDNGNDIWEDLKNIKFNK